MSGHFNDLAEQMGVGADDVAGQPECEQCHETLPPGLPLKRRSRHFPTISVVSIHEYVTCPLCGWDNLIAWQDVETGNPHGGGEAEGGE